MGSLKRAQLRREQQEKEKEARRRSVTVGNITRTGLTRETASSILRGVEQAVDEETQRRVNAILDAVTITLREMERQVCLANVIICLKAVDKTLGQLKTTQKSWAKLLDNYSAVVDEVNENGMETVCNDVKKKLCVDFELEETDLEAAKVTWTQAALAANCLAQTVRERVNMEVPGGWPV